MAKRSKKRARQAARRAERRDEKRGTAPTPDPKALLLRRIFTEARDRHDEDARSAEREREREWLAEERRRARGGYGVPVEVRFKASVTLVPTLGAWHLRYPAYNAESVLGLLRESRPDVVVLAPLEPGALTAPAWQDTPEIALPLTVVPWAQRAGVRLTEGLSPSDDPDAEADFRRYAAGYAQTLEVLRSLDARMRPLDELLPQPLTLARVWDEVVPVLSEYQEAREAAFADGPATDWWRERHQALAEWIRGLPETRVTVVAGVEQVPFLRAALEAGGTQVLTPRDAPADERVRERALLDIAFRGDAADPGRLIAQLRELDGAEARFYEANLLLAHGHPAEALERLEGAANGDFSTPYYLPGYLLTRLGQLRDLVGDRDGAVRAYRGVMALEWVPQDAREAARAGLSAPFEGVPA